MSRDENIYKIVKMLEQRVIQLEKDKADQHDIPTWSDSFEKYWEYQLKTAREDA